MEMEAPEEQPQEEPPQDDPMNATDDAPDFGDFDINDEYSETESVMMRRTNELVNSEVYQHFADEENIEGEPSNLEQRPRKATPAMARFIHNVFGRDLNVLDSLLEADRERRQRRHEEGIPFVDTEVKEEIRYGEELEEERHKTFLHRHQPVISWRH